MAEAVPSVEAATSGRLLTLEAVERPLRFDGEGVESFSLLSSYRTLADQLTETALAPGGVVYDDEPGLLDRPLTVDPRRVLESRADPLDLLEMQQIGAQVNYLELPLEGTTRR